MLINNQWITLRKLNVREQVRSEGRGVKQESYIAGPKDLRKREREEVEEKVLVLVSETEAKTPEPKKETTQKEEEDVE